jgi:hypothetical protein
VSALEDGTVEQRERLRAAYPNAERIYTALMLARDVDTFHALYAGNCVNPELLDREQLARMRARKLVRLDVSAIDLMNVAA